MYICITKLLWCTAVINTTLHINHVSMQNLKKGQAGFITLNLWPKTYVSNRPGPNPRPSWDSVAKITWLHSRISSSLIRNFKHRQSYTASTQREDKQFKGVNLNWLLPFVRNWWREPTLTESHGLPARILRRTTLKSSFFISVFIQW